MKTPSFDLAKLAAPLPDLLSLSGPDARVVMALRIAVLSRKLGKDAAPALTEKLGNPMAVTRFFLVIEEIGCVWPDSFHIGRACCRCTTPDELTFLEMLRCVAGGDRPKFDRLVCEMIGDSERDRLFLDMKSFLIAYQPRLSSRGFTG